MGATVESKQAYSYKGIEYQSTSPLLQKTKIAVPFKPMKPAIAEGILNTRTRQEEEYKQKQIEHEEAVKGEIEERIDKLTQQAKRAGIPEEAVMFAGCDNEELLQVLRSTKINGKTLSYTSQYGEKCQITFGNHRAVYYIGDKKYEGDLIPDKIVIDNPKYGEKGVRTYIGTYKYGYGNMELSNAYKMEVFTKTTEGVYRKTCISDAPGHVEDGTEKFFNPQGKEISEEKYQRVVYAKILEINDKIDDSMHNK